MKPFDELFFSSLLDSSVFSNHTRLLNIFAKMPIDTQGLTIKYQSDFINKLITDRGRDYFKGHHNELRLACLLSAINKINQITESQKKKSSTNIHEAKVLAAINQQRFENAKKRKRTSAKSDKIRIKYFEMILTKRNEGMSWRDIAIYLSVNHNLKITYSYLRQEFEAEQTKRSNFNV